MKLLVLVLVVASAACCALGADIQQHYHETIGIPMATRIYKAESEGGAGGEGGAGQRVAGGTPAALTDFPYFAGLLVQLTNGYTSVCGATLLSNTRLLTAAHCWFDGRNQGESVTAVLASTRLFSGGVRVQSSQVEMHQQFNPRNLNNDLAMVTIPYVQYTNVIKPVTLPDTFLLWLTFEGSLGQLAGYGVARESEDITQNQSLRKTTALIVNNLDCQSAYGFDVVDSTICTSGRGGLGPCGGDSGGPLVVTLSGVDTLVGVTSFYAAFGCDMSYPGGYARVTSFVPWIQARL